MKNVTISMDEQTLRWVRVAAAEAGTSVSRWIADLLESRRADFDRKTAASARIEAILDSGFRLPLSENGKIFDREEMYDEILLRRYDEPAGAAGQFPTPEGADLQGVAESPPDPRPDDDKPSGAE